jgi:hypothetical protein
MTGMLGTLRMKGGGFMGWWQRRQAGVRVRAFVCVHQAWVLRVTAGWMHAPLSCALYACLPSYACHHAAGCFDMCMCVRIRTRM